MNPGVVLIYSTWPDEAEALACANTLLREGLAACCVLGGPAVSMYVWKGSVETASERVMWVKTIAAKATACIARMALLHPYETPAILALPVDAENSLPETLAWLADALA